MKIMYWASDTEGQAFWRMRVPGYAMESRGHEVYVGQRFEPEWQETADVVVAARTCQPDPSKVWQQLAAEKRARLVYDIDDDYLNCDPTNREALEFFSQPKIRDAIKRNVSIADVVTCASAALVEEYRQYGNTVVVPNGLPEEVLAWPGRPRNPDKLVIGWSGSSSTLYDLPILAKRLRRFLDRHLSRRPDRLIEVHTIGVTPQDVHWAGLRHPLVRVLPWQPAGYPYLRAIDFDIWLAPYRHTRFNRCKAPTKAIEAAFLGVPIIASDTDAYASFVRHGETGYLVHNDHEWDTYLTRLVEDDDLRKRMGRAARKQAADNTAEKHAGLWERAMGLKEGAPC